MSGCDDVHDVQVVYPINDLEGTFPIPPPKPLIQETSKSDDPSSTIAHPSNPIIRVPQIPKSVSIDPQPTQKTVTALKTVTVKNDNLGKSGKVPDLISINQHTYTRHVLQVFNVLINPGPLHGQSIQT